MIIQGIYTIADFMDFISERYPDKKNQYASDDINEFLNNSSPTSDQLQRIAKAVVKGRTYSTYPAAGVIIKAAEEEGVRERGSGAIQSGDYTDFKEYAKDLVRRKNWTARDMFKILSGFNKRIMAGEQMHAVDVNIQMLFDTMVYNAFARQEMGIDKKTNKTKTEIEFENIMRGEEIETEIGGTESQIEAIDKIKGRSASVHELINNIFAVDEWRNIPSNC